MAIKKETIEAFIEAINQDYREALSFEQASRMLNDLVGYFGLLARLNYQNNNSSEQGSGEQCTMQKKNE